jgi:hypothetical protein
VIASQYIAEPELPKRGRGAWRSTPVAGETAIGNSSCMKPAVDTDYLRKTTSVAKTAVDAKAKSRLL